MSVSNFIINFINKRRNKIQKNYSGSLGNFFKDGGNNFIYSKLKLNSDSFVIDGGGYQGEFIDNILSQNQIETKQLKTILQLNSIEGIKTAVSLGLGAAFVSSSAIEKEIKLKTIGIIKIENIQINRKLSIISNPECYKSKAFEFFYTELMRLKTRIEN